MYYSFSFYRWSIDWKNRIKNLEFVTEISENQNKNKIQWRKFLKYARLDRRYKSAFYDRVLFSTVGTKVIAFYSQLPVCYYISNNYYVIYKR